MKKIKRSNFALNIIKFRKQKSLSQVDLAKLTGLSTRMIAYYETKAVNPPLDKIKIISDALNVTIADIIGGDNENIEIANIDPRILKTAMMINNLNRNDKESIYNILKSIYEKQKYKKQLNKMKNQ